MEKHDHDGSRILKRVELAFARYRRRSDGRRSYPDQLKELAMSAVAAGVTPEAVARAAGVSSQSVSNWHRAGLVSETPCELKIVGSRNSQPDDRSEAMANALAAARIVLRSGVTIELPIGALTGAMIEVLNGEVR